MAPRLHRDDQDRSTPLRDDDALSRAAGDVAAPRRRLLAALRDAHAEAGARIARLRQPGTATPPRARLLREAEEQLRRVELVLAQLRERPRPGPFRDPRHAAAPDRAALAAEERRGADEARRLRDLAHLDGHYLAARLFDLTADERDAAARDLAGPRPH